MLGCSLFNYNIEIKKKPNGQDLTHRFTIQPSGHKSTVKQRKYLKLHFLKVQAIHLFANFFFRWHF